MRNDRRRGDSHPLHALVLGVCFATKAAAQAENSPYGPPQEPAIPSFGDPEDDRPDPNDPRGQREPEEPTGEKPRGPERPARGFGDRGSFAVTTAFDVGISSSAWDGSSAKRLSLFIEPALEYFVIRDVSIGAEFDLDSTTSQGYGADGSLVETTHFLVGGGPHVGVNLRLSRSVSLYPRLMIGLHRREQTERLISGLSLSVAASPTGVASVTRTGPWTEFGVPLLLHATPRFFVGFGPWIYHDFARAQGSSVGAEETGIGARFIAGGSWGGVGPESRLPQLSDAEPEAGKKPHFGDANCVVLSGETNLSIRSVSYSDVPSSVSSWALGPGVDWFVTDRFSLGLGFSFSHSQVVGLEGPRLVEQKNSGFGAQFRIGFDVSITDWLSWYPRISLAADTGSFSVTDGTNTNAASTIEGTTVGASLPLLVQVADHFFVGFGPSATHDLSRAYGRRGQQNRNTTIGANTLVGGWL